MYFDNRLHSTIKLRWAPTTVLIIGVHAKGELWFLMALFHLKGAPPGICSRLATSAK